MTKWGQYMSNKLNWSNLEEGLIPTYFISNSSPNAQRADGGIADDDEVNRSSRSWKTEQTYKRP